MGGDVCCAGLAEKLPIERIFREVTGHKMSAAIKRILLGKPKAERKAAQIQTAPVSRNSVVGYFEIDLLKIT
jgi:hypothetical protein